MGKGDIKSAKGKRFAGSYGKTRKRKKHNGKPVAQAASKPAKKTTDTDTAETSKKAATPKAAAKKPAAKKPAAAAKTTPKKAASKKSGDE